VQSEESRIKCKNGNEEDDDDDDDDDNLVIKVLFDE